MRLLDLFLGETRTSLRRLGVMATVAGCSNAALIAIVNRAAEHIKDGPPRITSVALFLLFILVYSYAQRYVLVTTSLEIERVVHRCRARLIGRLKVCELREIELIGRGRIYSAVSSDTQTISQTANGLVMAAQAGFLIICACVYLATISLTSLLVSCAFLTVVARIFLRKMASVNITLHQASEEESKLHDLVNGLLDGFKEVKLFSKRATAVLVDVVAVSERTAVFRTAAQQAMGANFIFSQIAFLLLLGTLVFVTPMFSSSYSGSVMESMTTVVFLIGPISALVATLPMATVANAAAENIYNLEKLLEEHTREDGTESSSQSRIAVPQALKTLELRRVFYSYTLEESQFNVGPVDLLIRAGEVIFITGGNGSGKSTLIKLLTGLYAPISGEVLVNGVPVTAWNVQEFRDQFCAVFSDFHLFRHLYGITIPDPQVTEAWLKEMEISNKTTIDGAAFSTVDLSTGQKKRLALVSAMLEDKPIVILDEWAADQDPHFRRKFYEELIPHMRAEGRTVIAVTHDDRYFQYSDRRLHMEEGMLSELTESHTNE